MYLDHANIVTPDLDATVRFFTEVIGLRAGHRPNFRVPGVWLYRDERPLIHLSQATGGSPATWLSSRIDHIALRVADPTEWTALLDRVNASGLDHQIHTPDDGSDFQLWVPLAAGVTVEVIVAP
ncbi:VOC family protein [Pseudomonas sp. Pseu.R1]|uniref:VOC family protein n=1 Tax=Pseudomonas sp. Pseu.R1 TaxID=3379818 RepID=UPI003B930BD9